MSKNKILLYLRDSRTDEFFFGIAEKLQSHFKVLIVCDEQVQIPKSLNQVKVFRITSEWGKNRFLKHLEKRDVIKGCTKISKILNISPSLCNLNYKNYSFELENTDQKQTLHQPNDDDLINRKVYYYYKIFNRIINLEKPKLCVLDCYDSPGSFILALLSERKKIFTVEITNNVFPFLGPSFCANYGLDRVPILFSALLKKRIPTPNLSSQRINIEKNPYLQESKKLARHVFYNTSLPNILRQIKNWKFHAFKLPRKKSFFISCSPIPKTPFLLFPLQVTPESSLVSQCPEFCNQEEVIRRLAQSAPLGCQIVVREHPNMIGRRPAKLFRKILALGNVKIGSPHVPLKDVLNKASFICSCTSTVALEALLEGKSVSLLGRPWFSVHQRAFKINRPEEAFLHKTDARKNNGLTTSTMIQYILNAVHLSDDSSKFSDSFKKCIHGNDAAVVIEDLVTKIEKYKLSPDNTRKFWWENYLSSQNKN